MPRPAMAGHLLRVWKKSCLWVFTPPFGRHLGHVIVMASVVLKLGYRNSLFVAVRQRTNDDGDSIS